MLNSFFSSLEKKTGVKMTEVMKLANSLQNANFKDEQTVRDVVRKVSSLANKSVSKEREEMIVQAILNGKVPKDFSSIQDMVNKKK